MRIKFFGASGEVTGSSYLLTSESGDSILIDYGLFQGSENLEKHNYIPLDCDVKNIKGVVLTHAHLDHCGRLPMLFNQGFSHNVFMTNPTLDITEISLLDSAKIMKENRGVLPLFSQEDVYKLIGSFKTVEYDEIFKIGVFDIVLSDAGHILGSASVNVTDTSSPEKKNIVFSGDLGNSPEDLIQPTEIINSANYVVMESTYGDRVHPSEDTSKLLLEEINTTEESNGVLLIPSFSIERSQEILHRISHLIKLGKINKETKFFFDSPMAEKVTEVFEKYHEYFNKELKHDIQESDPFHFPGLSYIQNYKESENIKNIKGPKVIIAGSGMMTGGRILSHAVDYLGKDTTRLLFVGYQGKGTLGRSILEGTKNVVISGNQIEIRASINQIQALSSHADQPKLIKWFSNIKNTEKLFITHGDQNVRPILSDKIKKELKFYDIYLPSINQEFDL